jgi:hypothetical protein
MKTNLFLLSICLVVGILLGTLAVAQMVPCRNNPNMPSPCHGIDYYECWNGCTRVDDGSERSNCVLTLANYCCQWREVRHTCIGGPCSNCPWLESEVEYVLSQYGWSCEFHANGVDRICKKRED